VNYYRTLLDILEKDLPALGVTRYARQIVDIYELISWTFETITIVLNVLKAVLNWVA